MDDHFSNLQTEAIYEHLRNGKILLEPTLVIAIVQRLRAAEVVCESAEPSQAVQFWQKIKEHWRW